MLLYYVWEKAFAEVEGAHTVDSEIRGKVGPTLARKTALKVLADGVAPSRGVVRILSLKDMKSRIRTIEEC